MEAGYRKLHVYQKAFGLTIWVYQVTKKFPREELFGLVSQMRRSAVSVGANIVEGYGRRTAKDKVQFYYMARGSLTELEYYLDLAFELRYLSKQEYEVGQRLRAEVGRLLGGFIKSIR